MSYDLYYLNIFFSIQIRFSDTIEQHVLDDWPREDYRDARMGPWFRYAIERRRVEKQT